MVSVVRGDVTDSVPTTRATRVSTGGKLGGLGRRYPWEYGCNPRSPASVSLPSSVGVSTYRRVGVSRERVQPRVTDTEGFDQSLGYHSPRPRRGGTDNTDTLGYLTGRLPPWDTDPGTWFGHSGLSQKDSGIEVGSPLPLSLSPTR